MKTFIEELEDIFTCLEPCYRCEEGEGSLRCESCGREIREQYWNSQRALFVCRECAEQFDGPVKVDEEKA